MRIGHGYDVHAFTEGRPLILGGVTIPYNRGLAAHSDGDVVIHALCDALLGAAALGEIGTHFPDNSEEYAGVDSRILLRSVVEKLLGSGWKPGNVDITVIAQAPKLAPHIPQMHEILSRDMAVELSAVSVKATTTERLGFIGREEGIAVHAVVLLQSA